MTDNEQLASDLERLCCAETEGKFFDLVTDSIATIIAALRENEQLRGTLREIKEMTPGHYAREHAIIDAALTTAKQGGET